MEKQKEIETLRSLKGDTYFGEYFGSDDIEQMCENIKNDFPIEMGCHFAEKERLLIKQVNAEKVRAAQLEEDMVKCFIKENKAAFSPEFYHYCAERVGRLFIIKCKRECGYALNDDELEFLIRTADRHINPENYQTSKNQ